MQEWDEFIDPVAIPEGAPFKFGGLEEGPLVKLVTDGGEEEPQTMGLGGPEPEKLQAKIEAAVKEQTEVGGVVMVYVTGEGEEQKVTGVALLDPPAPAEAEEAA